MRTESQNTKRCLSHSTLNAISHCTEPCSRTLEKFNKLSDEIIACLSILHSSRIVVREGEAVRQGQHIGDVGGTGLATGPHLHWGLKWNDARLDPLLFVGPMN